MPHRLLLGFSNRMILLYNGNFLKEGAMLRQVPPEIIFPPRSALIPITGLHFCEVISRSSEARGSEAGLKLKAFQKREIPKQPRAGHTYMQLLI